MNDQHIKCSHGNTVYKSDKHGMHAGLPDCCRILSRRQAQSESFVMPFRDIEVSVFGNVRLVKKGGE